MVKIHLSLIHILKDKNNHEVLIHVGIDTVNLNGNGFILHVSQGEKVQSGQLLLEFDIKMIEDKEIDLTTPVVFVGNQDINDLSLIHIYL